MKTVSILKALGNEKRLQILAWLKEPSAHFPPHQEVEGFEHGVCVAYIQRKSGLSQSTTSKFMSTLEQADLVIATRLGKWTYYKRNEASIRAFTEYMSAHL